MYSNNYHKGGPDTFPNPKVVLHCKPSSDHTDQNSTTRRTRGNVHNNQAIPNDTVRPATSLFQQGCSSSQTTKETPSLPHSSKQKNQSFRKSIADYIQSMLDPTIIQGPFKGYYVENQGIMLKLTCDQSTQTEERDHDSISAHNIISDINNATHSQPVGLPTKNSDNFSTIQRQNLNTSLLKSDHYKNKNSTRMSRARHHPYPQASSQPQYTTINYNVPQARQTQTKNVVNSDVEDQPLDLSITGNKLAVDNSSPNTKVSAISADTLKGCEPINESSELVTKISH